MTCRPRSLYLLGGVICAFYLESFHDWIVRHRKGIVVATVLVAVVPLVVDYMSHHGVRLSGILVPGGNPFAVLVIPYDVGASFVVYLLGVHLVSPRRSARTRAITASGSEAAYGIYVSPRVTSFGPVVSPAGSCPRRVELTHYPTTILMSQGE